MIRYFKRLICLIRSHAWARADDSWSIVASHEVVTCWRCSKYDLRLKPAPMGIFRSEDFWRANNSKPFRVIIRKAKTL